MTTIFEHTDEDGDRFTVEESITHRGWLLVETIDGSTDESAAAYLTPHDVTRLREALKPFDPTERAAEATTPAPSIEVGREYRLLPGARNVGGESGAVADGVTRVRVAEGDYPDGDYRVTALDGRRPGWAFYYTKPEYLAPLDEAPPTPLAEWHAAMRAWRTATVTLDNSGGTFTPRGVLDPARVAAVEKAFAILGADGHAVDVEAWLAVAEFLLGDGE